MVVDLPHFSRKCVCVKHSPQRIPRVLCGYFEQQRRVLFEGCVAEPGQTNPAILIDSKLVVLPFRIVMQDVLIEVPKVYPQLKLGI